MQPKKHSSKLENNFNTCIRFSFETELGKYTLLGIILGILLALSGFFLYKVNIEEIEENNISRSEKLHKLNFLMEYERHIERMTMPANDVLIHVANYLWTERKGTTLLIEEEKKNKLALEKSLNDFYVVNQKYFQEGGLQNAINNLKKVQALSNMIFNKMGEVIAPHSTQLSEEEIIVLYKKSVLQMEELDDLVYSIVDNEISPLREELQEKYAQDVILDEKSQDSAFNKVQIAVILAIIFIFLGGVIGLYAIGASEVQRRRIKESEEKFKSIIETTEEGFLLINSSYIILDVNETFCNIVGIEKSELLNNSLIDVMGNELETIFQPLFNGEKLPFRKQQEVMLTARNGKTLYTVFNITVLTRIKNIPEQLFAFISDITERKKAEQALYEEKRDMEMALGNAADVLDHLSKKPSLIPFFEASPIYNAFREVGGGDTVR
ncbi:MAG: PAS domain S-box protein, partial [Nitrospinae bacterium]|nr:PAS domain S-box protein [Nitrospinota bacterium]